MDRLRILKTTGTTSIISSFTPHIITMGNLTNTWEAKHKLLHFERGRMPTGIIVNKNRFHIKPTIKTKSNHVTSTNTKHYDLSFFRLGTYNVLLEV